MSICADGMGDFLPQQAVNAAMGDYSTQDLANTLRALVQAFDTLGAWDDNERIKLLRAIPIVERFGTTGMHRDEPAHDDCHAIDTIPNLRFWIEHVGLNDGHDECAT